MSTSLSKTFPLDILFEDEQLLVLNKSSGMLVHRGWAADRVVLVDLVRRYLNAENVYPAHRIDRQTSGVVIFAKDVNTAKYLGAAFDNGAVRKCYVALVRGRPASEGVIDHPVPKKEKGERVSAVTRFSLIDSVPLPIRTLSLVAAYPKTGRLHQIRRHLKHISHPIIGDANYGKGPLNRAIRDEYGLARLALHALKTTLLHPATGIEMSYCADLTDDLAGPLARMGFAALDAERF